LDDLAVARHLPRGRLQAGDRHLKSNKIWDNLAISVDGGYVLAARERAHSAAAQAARAGANAVSTDSVRSGGADLDTAAASDAAQAVLSKDNLVGTVTVTGSQVTVTVTTTTNTVMLGIVGINNLTVHASAAARDVDGVTTMEP